MAHVLIVGAGPTGLAVACGLLSAGVAVRIVDGADGPATTSRALGLQPRGVEVLDRLGALADLPKRSVRMAGTVIWVEGQQKLRLTIPSGEVVGGQTPLVISQAEIEAQLRSRVAELGGRIEWGRELTDVAQHADEVSVSLADGDVARASWLVGCDGAGSRVRKAVDIRLVGETAAERFLLADVRLTLPVERGFGSMWVGDGGALAAVPLPGPDWWRLMAPHPHGEPDELTRQRVVELLSQMLSQRLGKAVPDIRDVSWISTFRIHRRLASSYRCDRVLLAGDAAHIHSPLGGQGMNTGIGDAENLAWKLALVASGYAGPGLLDSYEAERRPIGAAVVKSVGGLDKLLLSTNPVMRFVREHMLYPTVNYPAVQRRVWRKISQLGISYRKGPLAHGAERRFQRRRSGDRVPDLPCRHTNGRHTRLHAELGGTWALLTGDEILADGLAGIACEYLGAERITTLIVPDWPPGRLVLVRPDAHIAWQGPASTNHLARWLNIALHGGTGGERAARYTPRAP